MNALPEIHTEVLRLHAMTTLAIRGVDSAPVGDDLDAVAHASWTLEILAERLGVLAGRLERLNLSTGDA